MLKPWAIIVLELKGDKIAAWNSFLDTRSYSRSSACRRRRLCNTNVESTSRNL